MLTIILTYTGSSISLVALVVSIVIYMIFNMYKSTSGTLGLGLFITLFLSSLLFMAGIGVTDSDKVCYCIGVCQHYLWLLVFAFKSVTLVHITYTIRTMIYNSTLVVAREFFSRIKLIVLCLILPLTFLVPSVIFNYFDIFYLLRVEYNNKACFPTGFHGNIIFVSIPIGLSITTNICCLFCLSFFGFLVFWQPPSAVLSPS